MVEDKTYDNCRRGPVDLDKIPSHIPQALLALKKTGKISDFEFFIVYCYLFNGVSLKMLRDRIFRETQTGYEFSSKQHIHQNIISKVINLMKKEIERIKEVKKEGNSDVPDTGSNHSG